MAATNEIVRFERVSKQYPGTLANDDVTLSIQKGEVFALVGENGAGKSTLMNLLFGMQKPTLGDIYIKGQKVGAQHGPENAMRIEITIPESDLLYVSEGDNVEITFDWQDGTTEPIPGVISVIAAASDADTDDTAYTAYVDFTPDETVRYGMNVTVSTVE